MLLGIHPVLWTRWRWGAAEEKKKAREACKKREEGGPLATGKRMDEQSELEIDARETQQKASGKKKKQGRIIRHPFFVIFLACRCSAWGGLGNAANASLKPYLSLSVALLCRARERTAQRSAGACFNVRTW